MPFTLKSQQWMVILCVLPFLTPQVSAQRFLVERPAGWEAKVQADMVRTDLERAMADALGHGHGVEHSRLLQIRGYLSTLFQSLPKNSHGRIERSMVRYALHRYFAERYGITVKGLEPTKFKHTSQGHVGAQILLDNVPAYAEAVLEGRFANHGFGLEDSVVMAASLEQLVLGSGTWALQKAYNLQNFTTSASLPRESFEELLNAYVLQWLVGDAADIDSEEFRNTSNRALIEESVPQWIQIRDFARGEVDRLEHERQNGNPFVSETQYNLKDAQNVVRSITAGFGHWWEPTCQEIKGNLLAEQDASNAGRVRLSAFYRRNIQKGEWRFGESEAYLRELGVLDDTSSWRGPQVIIPNYMQSSSNCIITSTYYHVCCINECEALLKQVEDGIKAPVATPSEVLEIVKNMTAMEVDRPGLHTSLSQQISRIAETHDGKVPLHGRLFAQWMHYAFPQECPFPYRGAKARTPAEFGDDHIASEEEMRRHVKEGKRSESQRQSNGIVEEDEEERWSQWVHEEELLADYVDLQPPMVPGTTCLFILAMVLGAVALSFRGISLNLFMSSGAKKDTFGMSVKHHLV